MNSFVINEKFYGKEKINSFNDVLVDDHYNLEKEEEGYRIIGKVSISGTVNYELNQESYQKDIDINIFIPNSKIESRNNIKVTMDSFNYDIRDNILLLKLKLIVNGEIQEDEKLSLETKNNIKNAIFDQLLQDETIITTTQRKFTRDDFISQVEDMIQNQDVDVISTMDNNDVQDIFDIRIAKDDENANEDRESVPINSINDEIENNIDKEDLAVDELPKYNNEEEKDTKKEVEPIPLPLVDEDSIPVSKEIIEKEQLLKDEYVTSFFFHRVKKGETLTDIINRYHLSLDEFRKYNINTDIKENDLLEIKIK